MSQGEKMETDVELIARVRERTSKGIDPEMADTRELCNRLEVVGRKERGENRNEIADAADSAATSPALAALMQPTGAANGCSREDAEVFIAQHDAAPSPATVDVEEAPWTVPPFCGSRDGCEIDECSCATAEQKSVFRAYAALMQAVNECEHGNGSAGDVCELARNACTHIRSLASALETSEKRANEQAQYAEALGKEAADACEELEQETVARIHAEAALETEQAKSVERIAAIDAKCNEVAALNEALIAAEALARDWEQKYRKACARGLGPDTGANRALDESGITND